MRVTEADSPDMLDMAGSICVGEGGERYECGIE